MKKSDTYKKEKYISTKRILITFEILIVLFVTALYFPFSISPFSFSVGLTQPIPPKAAIVDQGSLAPTSGPNPVFVKKATDILKEAGFSVDYYPGEEVTVEFYRNLPNYGYDLIIERTHSAIHNPDKYKQLDSILDSPKKSHLCIFTNEVVTKEKVEKYFFDVVNDRLVGSFYKKGDEKNGNLYFGITPCFVMLSMRWRFDKTTVIMMGCDGLKEERMAEAYINKGCKVYISWSGLVSSNYSDEATISLLYHLLREKLPVNSAVTKTMRDMGPDPKYKSVMQFYPMQAGSDMVNAK
jgi:hypothetical protein